MIETEPPLGLYEFGSFRLDVVERSLWHRQDRVPLGGRALDVLAALVRQAGRLVTKDELLRQAWKGRVVEEGNIHVQISSLRKLLGDKAIATVSGYGYRFELPLGRGDIATANESNLPAALTPLVARGQELAELGELMSRQRLVTIKGMGGIGKSRVAIETCRLVQRTSPTLRCWHVPVGPTEQGGSLQSTVLHSVRRRPNPPNDIATTLVAILREKPTILLLDGCEMIAEDDARAVRSMLEQCPELKILCTSRRSLGLVGEAIYELPTLSLEDAKALFLERAASASSSFKASKVDTQLLERILEQLDGIPLAIELASSRLRAVGMKELEQQLSDRLNTLVGSDRSLPTRQSTLRATLEWSYRLLTDEERRFLNRLSVFQAPFTAEAAAYVGLGQTSPAGLAIELLTGLIDKSFLSPHESDQQSQYRILDSVREFGWSELLRCDETLEIQERRAKYFADYMSRSVTLQCRSEWFSDHLPAMRTCWPDLLASLTFAFANHTTHAELGAKLASFLLYFWMDEGRIDEAEQWLQQFIHAGGVTTETMLSLMLAQGCVYSEKGMARKATETLKATVSGYEKLGSSAQELAISANELGINLFGLLDYGGARKYYDLAIRINRAVGNPAREGQALQNLAVLEFVSGDIKVAEDLLARAIDLHRLCGNVRSESTSSIWLSECKFLSDQYEEAVELLRRAKKLRSPVTTDLPSASIAFRIARSSAMLGNFEQASRSSLEALLILESIGNVRATLECLDAIAIVARETGQLSDCISLMSRIEGWRSESSVPRSPLWEAYFSSLKAGFGIEGHQGIKLESRDGEVDIETLRIARGVASAAGRCGKS